jgi:hypothetical protein
MILPKQTEPLGMFVSETTMSGKGIRPSFCSPCLLGKQVCCDFDFTPPFIHCSVKDCDGGQVFCLPCIPGINKKFCIPGGFVDC